MEISQKENKLGKLSNIKEFIRKPDDKKFVAIPKSEVIKNLLNFITVRENVCILFEINKYFLEMISAIYSKDNKKDNKEVNKEDNKVAVGIQNNVAICLKEIRINIVKNLDDFKIFTNNHCLNIDDRIKDLKNLYSILTLNRAVYVISYSLFKDLQTLDLQKNNMGLDGIILLSPYLKKTKVLVILNMAYNNILDEGSKFLATALQNNKSLQILNIECNCISDQGLSYLSGMIVKSKSLKKVKMALNLVTIEGVKLLAGFVENSESQIDLIDFHYNNIVLMRDENQLEYYRKNKITF